jgi:hypothetical protein
MPVPVVLRNRGCICRIRHAELNDGVKLMIIILLSYLVAGQFNAIVSVINF